SYGDWADWQRVPRCGDAPCGATVHAESIAVAGRDEPETLEVAETAWGPVLHEEADGSFLALRWIAHLPGALDLGLTGMARAADVDDALALRVAMPAQNLVVGDASGRIAWRLLGPMPLRAEGCDALGAGDPAACPPWPTTLDGAPAIPYPFAGRAWTANTRVVDAAELQAIGDGGYVLGARGAQIRDALFARERFDEAGLFAIQLDDRAVFLTRWGELLRDEAARDPSPALAALAEAAATWEGHAAVDSASYRLVRAWRLAVHERIADGLLAPARAALGDDVR